ncbi:hypothetical protein [Limosilactobacillus sp.]|uniref:hypothetical protein n=1 Tax=Limosilactobacillus sp. TaxID=2773925 RepID=UPI00345F0778
MSQTLLKNGRRVVAGQLVASDVLIEDGVKIAAVGTKLSANDDATINVTWTTT